MIKVIGCIVIVFASSGLGYMLGAKFKTRVKELGLIKITLQMLETEIVYSNTPLPDAFEIIYTKSSAPVNSMFKSMSRLLNEKTHSTVGEAFKCALEEVKDTLCINKEDVELLKSFGNSLGSSDIDGQIKNFKMTIKQIEIQEKKAEESRSKNERMYKNLGILAGLAIAIILM